MLYDPLLDVLKATIIQDDSRIVLSDEEKTTVLSLTRGDLAKVIDTLLVRGFLACETKKPGKSYIRDLGHGGGKVWASCNLMPTPDGLDAVNCTALITKRSRTTYEGASPEMLAIEPVKSEAKLTPLLIVLGFVEGIRMVQDEHGYIGYKLLLSKTKARKLATIMDTKPVLAKVLGGVVQLQRTIADLEELSEFNLLASDHEIGAQLTAGGTCIKFDREISLSRGMGIATTCMRQHTRLTVIHCL